jgi:hypothetical protein
VAEIAMLARVAAEAGGVYSTHIRDEAVHVIESLDEAFSAAAQAGVPVVISHHKWRRAGELGPLGGDAGAYPQRARSCGSARCVPVCRRSTILRPEAVDGIIDIMVTWSVPYPKCAPDAGDIASEWQCTQLEACNRLQPGGAIYFQMREDDVQRVLKFEATMIGSDGLPHDRHPHPRLCGARSRAGARHYSRDVGLFPLEEACTMTGLFRAAVQPGPGAARSQRATSPTSSCSIPRASSTADVRRAHARGRRASTGMVAGACYGPQRRDRRSAGRFLHRGRVRMTPCPWPAALRLRTPASATSAAASRGCSTRRAARDLRAGRVSDRVLGVDQPAQVQPQAPARVRLHRPGQLRDIVDRPSSGRRSDHGEFTVLVVTLVAVLGICRDRCSTSVPGRGSLRTLCCLPWAIPPVVNGLMWQWIYDSKIGALNGLLVSLGIIEIPGLAVDADLGAAGARFADVWNVLPLAVILLLAALQRIPSSSTSRPHRRRGPVPAVPLRDAAVAGANAARRADPADAVGDPRVRRDLRADCRRTGHRDRRR